MKISHKPIKRRKGLNQKTITAFKSKEELRKEIKTLEEQRMRYYLDYVTILQKIEIEHKRTTLEMYTDSVRMQEAIKNKRIKVEHETKTYNELVRPIDKKLKELRLEVMTRFPNTYYQVDGRLKREQRK